MELAYVDHSQLVSRVSIGRPVEAVDPATMPQPPSALPRIQPPRLR